MRRLSAALAAAAALTALAALAGCGGDSGDTPGEPGDGPVAPAEITFEKSGGIAYTFQRLEISPAGEAKLILGGDPAVRFRVPEARLAALREAAAAADLEEVGPINETGCADCFVYSVSLGDARGTRDQSDMPEAFAALVDELLAIARAHGAT